MLAWVLTLALALRLAPQVFYRVWGSDTGEYLAITRHLVRTGGLPSGYDGWGFAYPEFPGMQTVVAQVSLLTGLDPFSVLVLLVPATGVLTVAATYLLADRLWGGREALWAALFSAVWMPLVYTTSHPMPETLGHGLALVALYLALDADRPSRGAASAAVGLAVVVTHHLSTYFLLIGLAALWAWRVLSSRGSGWGRLSVLLVVALGTVAHWTLRAPGFRDRILGPTVPAVAAWALAVVVAAVLVAVARLRPRIEGTVRLPEASTHREPRLAAAAVGCGLVAVAGFVWVGVPGVSARLDPVHLPWILPMVAGLGLVPYGATLLRRTDDGGALYLWAAGIGASLVVGAVWRPTVLIPYRHVPFLSVPAVLVAGAGAARWVRPGRRGRRRVVALGLASALALTAYPPASALAGFQEGITDEEFAAVEWADRNLPQDATVLADHRLSSLLFGIAGMDPTWDAGEAAWYAPTFRDAEPVLRSVSTPGGRQRIEYVVVSPVTEQGVALTQWDPAEPLSGDARAKFSDPPFVPVYGRDGVWIYRIAWETVS